MRNTDSTLQEKERVGCAVLIPYNLLRCGIVAPVAGFCDVLKILEREAAKFLDSGKKHSRSLRCYIQCGHLV